MSEIEFIAQEQKKQDVILRKQLMYVVKHGEASSRKINELLSINGLIEVRSANEDFKYSHEELTATGKSTLAYLKARLGKVN